MELLFNRIATLDQGVTPERCKVHLATSDGRRDPLTLYRKRDFDEWQRFQGVLKRPFSARKRSIVVSLIRTENPERWILAGIYDVTDEEERPVAPHEEWGWGPAWMSTVYEMSRRSTCDALEGLIVRFARSARAAYRRGETVASELEVHEEDQKDQIVTSSRERL